MKKYTKKLIVVELIPKWSSSPHLIDHDSHSNPQAWEREFNEI